MNPETYLTELFMLIVGALVGWLPTRRKQKVDTKQIEVEVLEKSLQVIHKDVVEPLTERFVMLQDEYSEAVKQIKLLRDALDKTYSCRFVAACPIRSELQKQKINSKPLGRNKQSTNRQREPGCTEDSDSDSDPSGINTNEYPSG